ncbi:unnamed protein product [Leptosia nina]|uniref:Uncharacterized protein n=1 Tax=Leptosia nina TaxID=320188 RepID=A0AAV1JPR8_9NEOP
MLKNIAELVALAAVIHLTLVGSRPAEARSVDLADVFNRTVCPIKVEIDENPHRVPRKIKMLKCAEEPRDWCRQPEVPPHLQHECCRHSRHGHVMECVELHDTVLVFDKKKNEMVTLDVAVGCSCIVEKSTRAPPVEQSPT